MWAQILHPGFRMTQKKQFLSSLDSRTHSLNVRNLFAPLYLLHEMTKNQSRLFHRVRRMPGIVKDPMGGFSCHRDICCSWARPVDLNGIR